MLDMEEMRTRQCTHHLKMCNCTHEFCKREWSKLCIAYNHQFNGRKDWSEKYNENLGNGRGQNGDLHSLLESLNALGTEPSGPAPTLAVGGWQTHVPTPQEIPIPPRTVHFSIGIYESDMRKPKNGYQYVSGSELDLKEEDSLADHVVEQAKFPGYTQISATREGVTHTFDLKHPTYSQTRSAIYNFSQDAFNIRDVGTVHIYVYQRPMAAGD
jgi:hypothetical protein